MRIHIPRRLTARAAGHLLVLAAGMLSLPRPAAAQNTQPAQRVVQASERVVLVARGQTAILLQPVALQRLSIADPEVAEIFAVSPQEILVNGKKLGTTSLMLWDASGARRMYTVEVTPDVRALEQTLRTLFPAERFTVLASGSSVVLSGTISSAGAARRMLEVAGGSGATIVNNLAAPAAPQVLLQVRFAEVTRTAVQELRTQIGVSVGGGSANDYGAVQTLSDGLVRLFLLGGNTHIEASIQAMQARGLFRSLAEPNLLALDGQEASFLAGGEFPFPVIQGGGNNATVTVVWKEFGVRLRFRPNVVGDGTIRLHIAPEVSSLDYSNSLRIEGFQIPSLLTRRTETEVVLRDGQYLAIAGLLNNVLEQNTSRIPLLGDLPVLGTLFRSRNARQGRTELLVLVSPRIVQASSAPQPVPTGEPGTWGWERSLRDAPGAPQQHPAAPRQP